MSTPNQTNTTTNGSKENTVHESQATARAIIDAFLQITTGEGIEAADDALTDEVRTELNAFHNAGVNWYSMEAAADTFGLTANEYAATIDAVGSSNRGHAETDMHCWIVAAGVVYESREVA